MTGGYSRRVAVWMTLIGLLPATAGLGQSEEPPDPATIDARFQELLRARSEADATTFAQERLAQEYEETFVAFWDALRAAGDPFAVFAGFQFDQIRLGHAGADTVGSEQVHRAMLNRSPRVLDHGAWQALVDTFRNTGFEIVQTEWHHATFEADEGAPRRSVFNIVIDVRQPGQQLWAEIRGPLRIVWSDASDDRGLHLPQSIDATGLTVAWRTGQAMFEIEPLALVTYPSNYGTIGVFDLNEDGRPDIVCPPENAMFQNAGDGHFIRKELFKYPSAFIIESLLADFNGDGHVDCLIAGANPVGRAVNYRLYLYPGDGSGRFDAGAQAAADADLLLDFPIGMSAGDIDGDGDLDLFVPQYLQPYIEGQFPTPYFDANDGYPSYLMENDGSGFFTDITEAAGLAAKRHRRTFRSSLVDLDDDHDLDLLVVSDFAGVDVYHNDGAGRFTDVTEQTVDLATNFGMAHTFGDFDSDGRIDFYVTGMASTTARRLEQMGIRHEGDGFDRHNDIRTEIAYGNRMYMKGAGGSYTQPIFRDSVARSGWSWGCTNLDFNNDGYRDIYVSNGNKSGTTAKDYCTRFWCHDIYSGSSDKDVAQFKLYLEEAVPYMQEGISWNGFEHNHLFMNDGGTDFSNVAFLMNVAFESDCRSAISDDFDGDGRPDLLVDSRAIDTDKHRQLTIFYNRHPNPGNWIGVRLKGARGVSTIGATISVFTESGVQRATIVTGDSYGAQHAPAAHFGLGERDVVERVEVRWPNGNVTTLDEPSVNTWHRISGG